MEKSFFSEFKTVTVEDQLAKIHLDLGGKEGYQNLIWNAPEGINVHPIYPQKEISVTPSAIKECISWKITQYLSFNQDQALFLRRIEKALNNGVEALYLEINAPCDFIQALKRLLHNTTCTVFFVFRHLPKESTLQLIESFDQAVLCFDFQAEGLLQGGWSKSYTDSKNQWLLLNIKAKPRMVLVNAAIYANAGAHISQQLSYALLHLNEYLNTLSQNQQKTSIKVFVKFAFGSNYFFEIAKCHAFKAMAENLFKAYDFPIQLSLIGEPLQRNKCTMDYNVNLLRTSAEMMSAVLGTVDYVMNHPYDLRFNPPSDFSDRMARNQLLLLKYESGFDQLPSPVEGTHYITSMIEELKAKAWSHFLAEEAKGGWEKIVQSNQLKNNITTTAAAEKARINSEEQVLVGATKYQDTATLSAAIETKDLIPKFTDFKPLTTNYLQQ